MKDELLGYDGVLSGDAGAGYVYDIFPIGKELYFGGNLTTPEGRATNLLRYKVDGSNF